MIARDPTEHLDSPRPPRRLPRTLSMRRRGRAHRGARRRPSGRAPRPRARSSCCTHRVCARPRRSALRIEDVNLSAGYVVPTGKGSRQRLVPVGAHALRWVRLYLKTARPALVKRREPGHALREPVRAGRSRARRCGASSRSARGAPTSAPRSRRTRCATPSRAISSSAAPICDPCRRCWATPTSPPRRSTRTCRPARSATCTCAFILARGRRAERWRRPAWAIRKSRHG